VLASRAEVWRYLSEPYHLSDWWPTVSAVRPDARRFREGARWGVTGPSSPTLFRKGGAIGTAIVKTIELHERVVWSLTADRLELEVRLVQIEPDRTLVTVAVEGMWRPEAFGRPRALPKAAAYRLYELVQTAASLNGDRDA
jgi:uncharacterized protein YndB with AHSA1/START domain